MRLISGILRFTPLPSLPVLSNIERQPYKGRDGSSMFQASKENCQTWQLVNPTRYPQGTNDVQTDVGNQHISEPQAGQQ